MVFNTREIFLKELTQIIAETLFFNFDEMITIPWIPWKFRMDGYGLEFDAQTIVGVIDYFESHSVECLKRMIPKSMFIYSHSLIFFARVYV